MLRYSFIFRKVIHFFETSELLPLSVISKQWKDYIQLKISQRQSKLDKILFAYDCLSKNYPENKNIDDSGFVSCSDEIIENDIGVALEFQFGRDGALYLKLTCLDGSHYPVEMKIDYPINMGDYFDDFHENSKGQYFLHFTDNVTLSFKLDDNYNISHQLHYHDVVNIPNDLQFLRFVICKTCFAIEPIDSKMMNKRFLEKAHKDEKYCFFAWEKNNFVIFRNEGSICKIYSQIDKNGEICYKKLKIPLLLCQDDCPPSCRSWHLSMGQLVIMHQYPTGFWYRICDITNDVDIKFQRNTKLPIHFGRKSFPVYHHQELIWVKKFKQFIGVGQTSDLEQTIVSNHECNFDLGDLGVRINKVDVCEKSNQLLLFHLQGLIIYDLYRFLTTQ